jgi:hypothetical protein
MRTHLRSLGALAAARRRGNLAGNWSNIVDRDLHRAAADLLAQSYDDGAWANFVVAEADPIAPTFDLEARRSRGAKPAPAPTSAAHHARAS